jgi:hypothetical protein
MEGPAVTAKSTKNAEPAAEQAKASEKFPRTVRTTFRPDQDVQVSATEYAELKAQGVLVEQKNREN